MWESPGFTWLLGEVGVAEYSSRNFLCGVVAFDPPPPLLSFFFGMRVAGTITLDL